MVCAHARILRVRATATCIERYAGVAMPSNAARGTRVRVRFGSKAGAEVVRLPRAATLIRRASMPATEFVAAPITMICNEGRISDPARGSRSTKRTS